MFGRATIRLGIGPHSSIFLCYGGDVVIVFLMAVPARLVDTSSTIVGNMQLKTSFHSIMQHVH